MRNWVGVHNRAKGRGWAVGALVVTLVSGLAVANAAEEPDVVAAAKAAVGKNQLEKTKLLGPGTGQIPFRDVPSEGAVLVGFELAVSSALRSDTIVQAVRPIYLTAKGDKNGLNYGLFGDTGAEKSKNRASVRTQRVRAKPGYAVSGITVRSGAAINGMSVSFMRMKNGKLDPTESYVSTWYGDQRAGQEAYISGNASPIVGIFGTKNERQVLGLGLVHIGTPAVVAKAPEPPIEKLPPPTPGEIPVPAAAQGEQATAGTIPFAAPEEADEGISWLPFAVFGAVALPILLLLLVLFGRKKASDDGTYRTRVRDRRPAGERGERAVREREREPRRAPPDDDEEILEVLPAPEPTGDVQLPRAKRLPPDLRSEPEPRGGVRAELPRAKKLSPDLPPEPEPRGDVQAELPRTKKLPPLPPPPIEIPAVLQKGMRIECPHCHHRIGTTEGMPPWCPACGADLKASASTPPPQVLERSSSPPVASLPVPSASLSASITESRSDRQLLETPRRRPAKAEGFQQPPYFTARVTRHFSPNRHYRVYVLPEELLFIEVGAPEGDQSAVMVGWLAFGLIGALVAQSFQGDAKRKAAQRAQEVDDASLEDLLWMADNDKGCFRGNAEDLANVRIEPAAFWHTVMFTTTSYHGLLRFNHFNRGAFTMEFLKLDEMRLAVEQLPVVLGDAVSVQVAWDKKKWRFVGTK